MNLRLFAAVSATALLVAACSKSDDSGEIVDAAAGTPKHAAEQPDRFTYSNYNEVRVTDAALDLDVRFEEKILDGSVVLAIDYIDPDARSLVLDTNDLTIKSVEAQRGGVWSAAKFELSPDDEVMGSKLEITLPERANKVRIAYSTSPTAEGVQWLAPEQTAAKTQPFMYTQGQAINTRSIVPIQDTPAVRITYSATLRTPRELIAVMSAQQDPDGARDGEYHFEMPQPVPAYLMAVAAGDLEFERISDHMGVYAEDYIVEAAAREFDDTPEMERVTERLYGPYRWGRYDMLVLPPSFPFGGMENPRLTFLTPTLVTGDKSLVATVAHELAHSWSGNLVTNATWRDPWLNEGFTSYVENRIIEEVYGRERAVMEQALARNDLERDVREAERPELTQLKLPEDLAHPDEGFSQVAYVKGQFFLMFLEERFGREAFDAFLKDYFDHFAFKSITTEDFLDYFRENLAGSNPGKVTDAEIEEWLYKPGIPSTIATPSSDAFERVSAQQKEWLDATVPAAEIATADWSAHEWLHFINSLPDAVTKEQLAALDSAFKLSSSNNAEIASAWYLKAIPKGYEPAMPDVEAFLKRVGRGKFIYRLYGSLADNGRKAWAQEVYEAARPGYHPIAQRRIDEILK
jgi:aminopeptidase N